MGKLDDMAMNAVPGTTFGNLSAFENNSTFQPSKFTPEDFLTNAYLITTCIKFPILSFGVWANAIVLRAFVRMGLDDSVSIAFFTLAVCDFCSVLSGSLSLPFSILSYLGLKQIFLFIIQPSIFELLLLALGFASNIMATYVTTVLACQRCLCIVRPLQFKDMLSKTKSWVLVSAFLPYPVAMMILGWTALRVVPRLHPYWNRTQFVLIPTPTVDLLDSIYMFQSFIFPCICQVLSTGSVIVMNNKLIASVKFRKNASEIKSQPGASLDLADSRTKDKSVDKNVLGTKERTAIIQVVLISLIFLIVNLYKITFAVIGMIVPGFNVYGFYSNIFMVITYTMYTLEYINASLNFFIYYNYNSRFRKLCFK